MADWLRVALKAEAESHLPSRERMHARIVANRRPRWDWRDWRPERLRLTMVAAVAASVTAVVTLGIPYVAKLLATPSPTAPAIAVPMTASPSRGSSETATATPGPVLVSAEARLDPHSNPYWAQNNLVVTLVQSVTELRVEIRVARGEGVEVTGAWVGLPAEDFAETRTTLPDAFLFVWELKPGRKVWAGKWTFAAQYNRTQAHTGTEDTYTVTTPGATVRGHFRRPIKKSP
ncbi:hypothetical protein [Acrocarpospora catenulata]|uniref:hypothetical protein n=1 Tax=Acrocarpospora catenulata TaxID=2836182 RepID=UPI001BDA8683|nr:hypothetical protein [Acrocarpospora catenulata]